MRIRKTIIVVISTICMVAGSLGSFPFTSLAADVQPGDETSAQQPTVSEQTTAPGTADGTTPSGSENLQGDDSGQTAIPAEQQTGTDPAAEGSAELSDTLTKEIKASDGRTYVVTVSGILKSGIPATAELKIEEVLNPETSADAKKLEKKDKKKTTDEEKQQIERNSHYSDYVEQSAKVLKEKAEDLSFALPFDITIVDPVTKEAYQPTDDVKVSIQLADVELKKDAKINVVHFDEQDGKEEYEKAKVELEAKVKEGDKKAIAELEDAKLLSEIGSPEKMKAKTKEDTVAFSTDGFSVYVVVTETKSQKLVASDGTTYNVTATYDYTAGIPKDAVLTVSEIANTDAAYADYLAKSAQAINRKEDTIQYAKALDIYFADPATGKHITPGKNVKINVEILDEKLNGINISSVVHFGKEVEVVDSSVKGQNVKFENDEFSVYIITFYAEENPDVTYQFTIEESGSILLSELLSELKIPKAASVEEEPVEGEPAEITVNDVKNVVSDDPFILLAEKEDAVDWRITSSDPFVGELGLELELTDGTKIMILVSTEEQKEEIEPERVLQKTLKTIDGDRVTWEVQANMEGLTLNEGNPLSLKDSFNAKDLGKQSIDYTSITINPENIKYDYNESTGTFVIPDATPVTITYQTRVKFGTPGEEVTIGGTLQLLTDDEDVFWEFQADETAQTVSVYPSSSDVTNITDNYELNLYVHEEGDMNKSLSGARFILLDANQNYIQADPTDENTALIYPENEEGTGDDGCATVTESKGIKLEKNTLYYLEMIQAPEGYRKDNALYAFMITDNASQTSGDVATFYSGDTMKVGVRKSSPGLNAAIRFSGNFSLDEGERNSVDIILKKEKTPNSQVWEEVERHSAGESKNGTIVFDYNSFEVGVNYRIEQENDLPVSADPSTVDHVANYFVVHSGDRANTPSYNPIEFTVTESDLENGFDAIIINKYEVHKLTITKMNKETGERLQGAKFAVYKATDDSEIQNAEGTTDENGELVIQGGGSLRSETLYYAMEKEAPEGYVLPELEKRERIYFYFTNDLVLAETILEDLPSGKTAVNLSESYDSVLLNNQKKTCEIPVFVTWRGTDWPEGIVQNVEVVLCRETEGGIVEPVDDVDSITLTSENHEYARFENKRNPSQRYEFPAVDPATGDPIKYTIREKIYADANKETDITNRYVQSCNVSDQGIYVVFNEEATTLKVTKEWLNSGSTDEDNSKQSKILFDVYRTNGASPAPWESESDLVTVTREQIENFLSGLTPVRTNQQLGQEDDYLVISNLPKTDSSENNYNYYILETVPSFGGESYEIDRQNGTIKIVNQLLPDTVPINITLGEVQNDSGSAFAQHDFRFKVTLTKDGRPIRDYTVYDEENTPYETNSEGELEFLLKPESNVQLRLPLGVTADVTEVADSEFTIDAESPDGLEDESDASKTFRFAVNEAAAGKTIAFTNSLRLICKVVDTEGEEHGFESLSRAIKYIQDNQATVYSGEYAAIQMIADFTVPSWDDIVVPEGEKIILTTADDPTARFPFSTDREGAEASFAILSRGKDTDGSLLKNQGTLKLENIILDGEKASYAVEADGGLIYNEGELELTENTILRNSKVSGEHKGGAIYSTGAIRMTGGLITGNTAPNASAIDLAGSSSLTMSGGTIEGNSGSKDGAVVVETIDVKIFFSGNSVIFGNTNNQAQDNAANLYLKINQNNIINVLRGSVLGEDAKIGVKTNTKDLSDVGKGFGYAPGDPQNLDRFINDYYDYRGKQDVNGFVVWEGLKLNLKKQLNGEAGNAADSFTITLTSTSIKSWMYPTNPGDLDIKCRKANGDVPGTIVINNVKPGTPIEISNLPFGDYTISEQPCDYSVEYSGKMNADTSKEEIVNQYQTFTLKGDSTVTVTNTRRTAQLDLTTLLQDDLRAKDETEDFKLTVKLTYKNKDGSVSNVSGFHVQDNKTTNESGEAEIQFSPKNGDLNGDKQSLTVPVGATVLITENDAEDYDVTTGARTKDGAKPIENQDPSGANPFCFTQTDDGAVVTFTNVRRAARLLLRGDLVNKVSDQERFQVTVTLKNGNSVLKNTTVHYEYYKTDAETGEQEIVKESKTTDNNGKVVFYFEYPEGESSANYWLSLPRGTKVQATEATTNNTNGNYSPSYDIKVNGETVQSGSSYSTPEYTLNEADNSFIFTTARIQNKIIVSKVIDGGYAGNPQAFKFTATVTNSQDASQGSREYSEDSFDKGVRTFNLKKSETQELIVPKGAYLEIEEEFNGAYLLTIKNGSTTGNLTPSEPTTANPNTWKDRFQISANKTVTFTNKQLIGLQVINETSSAVSNVKVWIQNASDNRNKKYYLVSEDGKTRTALNVPTTAAGEFDIGTINANKKAVIMLEFTAVGTGEANQYQEYKIKGDISADNYLYTIQNEPSYHEYADPAMQRIYNTGQMNVGGSLRFSVKDSIVTITEQPMVNFDVNGGIWTTEMEGYNDKYGNDSDVSKRRQVYQMPVEKGEKVAEPNPDPIYSTGENFEFLGWTSSRSIAEAGHENDTRATVQGLFKFDETAIEEPITLYAVWKKPARTDKIVTVRNEYGTQAHVRVELYNERNERQGNRQLASYITTGLSTNNPVKVNMDITTAGTYWEYGFVWFDLPNDSSVDLQIPNGFNVVLQAETPAGAIAYSTGFTDADDDLGNNQFKISPVTNDGTVDIIRGVCKITDASGATLYDGSGNPRVYGTLEAAITAYNNGNNSKQPIATAAHIEMLVDEYAITKAHTLPKWSVVITTAKADDDPFPYLGFRERSMLYRKSYTNATCFQVPDASAVTTFSNIILDGKNIGLDASLNGGLLLINKAKAGVTITDGVVLRNVAFSSYGDVNGGRGAAISITNGTLTITGGLFQNLMARRGGAINAQGNAVLNISGTNASTQFVDCKTTSTSNNNKAADGGAIYYEAVATDSIGHLVINGGLDKNNPGIVFERCETDYGKSYADAKAGNAWGDGGAIYVNEKGTRTVKVTGCEFIECKAKIYSSGSTSGEGGGGIAVFKNKAAWIEACHFTGCDSLTCGGSIVAMVPKVTDNQNLENVIKENYPKNSYDDGNYYSVVIKNCKIEESNCRGQGGALAAYQNDNNEGQTVLYIEGTEFSNCSSGTNNGSGGAIQSYVPRIILDSTKFNNCWAGKEGGAINNWYGNVGQHWGSSCLITRNGCEFKNCRAEDRYEITGEVHYGGAIASKTKDMRILGSVFENCVSTLREGGAVHCSGFGSGSKVLIDGSNFKNCSAKANGGAVFVMGETLTVQNSVFEDCTAGVGATSSELTGSTRFGRGGAIGQGRGRSSYVPAEPKQTTITNSTFKNTYAWYNAGAIWTQAKNVTIQGGNFENCQAAHDGGVLYTELHLNDKNKSDATQITVVVDDYVDSNENRHPCNISNCEAGNMGGAFMLKKKTDSDPDASIKANITGCQANEGSAVYIEKSALFKGGTISGNIVASGNSAAVHGEKLYFENDIRVLNNTCSSDQTADHDVLLNKDDNTVINTTKTGLNSNAEIGVYVTGTDGALPYRAHGMPDTPFGTYDRSNNSSGHLNLGSFFNDRDTDLYGYQKSTNDSKIYWVYYVCKITNADGAVMKRPTGAVAVYPRLQDAMNDFDKVTDQAGQNTAQYVKMLVPKYPLKSDENTVSINIDPNKTPTLILTTASAEKDEEGQYVEGKYYYRGDEGTFCTISPYENANVDYLFTLTSRASFELEGIKLDGRKDPDAEQGTYGLVKATNGNVKINGITSTKTDDEGTVSVVDTTTLQYAGKPAVVTTSDASAIIVDSKNGDVLFDHCVTNENGGAISAAGELEIKNTSEDLDAETGKPEYKTSFTDCQAASGGAVFSNNGTAGNFSIEYARFENCKSSDNGGAVYHNNDVTGNNTVIKNCAFENCSAERSGGAVASKTGELTIEKCSFLGCSATENGGAINHDVSSQNREKTEIKDSQFERCVVDTTSSSNGNGGSVYTRAKTVEIQKDLFLESNASNNGGALYCENNAQDSETDISGTIFNKCNAVSGCGGAIFSKGSALTLQDSKIDTCTAVDRSGAVYMDTAGSSLKISGSTEITKCYAFEGAAVYLKSGVTMDLEGNNEGDTDVSPKFTENGHYKPREGAATQYTTNGTCIYLAEGSLLNLSGALTFSENGNNDAVRNGGEDMTRREDIFIAGYGNSGEKADSIYVKHKLFIKGDDIGSYIWVWPEKDPHQKADDQFAKASREVCENSPESLGKFRNGLGDGITGAGNENTFLSGVEDEYDENDPVNVKWNASYSVSFKKIDNLSNPVDEAEFMLFRDKDMSEDKAIAKAVSVNGKVTFESIKSGIYYMRETFTPEDYKNNEKKYLVLVGGPSLDPDGAFKEFWQGAPLDKSQRDTVVSNVTGAGLHVGVYELNEVDKVLYANVEVNLAGPENGIVNTLSYFESYFMKLDNNEDPLPGAKFAVYIWKGTGSDGFPILERYTRDKKSEYKTDYPMAESYDGKGNPDEHTYLNGETIEKGLVYFRDLPRGEYYLMEKEYPERNGKGRISFFVENEQIYKLIVKDENDFEMYKGEKKDDEYVFEDQVEKKEMPNGKEHYVIRNEVAVAKLTTDSALLYTKGHTVYERNADGELEGQTRMIPAIYSTLDEALEKAQNGTDLVVLGAPDDPVEPTKLQLLTDATMEEGAIIDKRSITLTTASTSPTTDRYYFYTDRTSDTSTAIIHRKYNEKTSENSNAGALFTVGDNEKAKTTLTLENIQLDGQNEESEGQNKQYYGRAVLVQNGNLVIKEKTKVKNFKLVAEKDSKDENNLQGGAVLVADSPNANQPNSLSIDGGTYRTVEFSGNEVANMRTSGSTGAEGGAIAISASSKIDFIKGVVFTGNSATSKAEPDLTGDPPKDGNGGAISYLSGSGVDPNGLKIENALFENNKATFSGGAIRAAEGTTVSVAATNTSNLSFKGNEAKYGAAVFAEKDAKVTLSGLAMQMNTAKEQGSAVYVENHAELTLSGCTIAENVAKGVDGGAINVGGDYAKIYLEGKEFIFGNTDANGTTHRNVVLNRDSNHVINTTEKGLSRDGIVGVYITDEATNNNTSTIYREHGFPGKPFGTIGEGTKANQNLNTFRNDRNLALYGESNGEEIRWAEAVCKLTDKNDILLYKEEPVPIPGTSRKVTVKTPAVYMDVQEGFDAAQGTLWIREGETTFKAFTGEISNDVKLKLLQDVSQEKGFTYKGKRVVTYTTAEKLENDIPYRFVEEILTFKPDDLSNRTSAIVTVTKSLGKNSMIKANGTQLILTNIVLDGNGSNGFQTTANGGIVDVQKGNLVVTDGAVLKNSITTGHGGAIYVKKNASALIEKGGTIIKNRASIGGAVYGDQGSVTTLTGGIIQENKADKGAGIYIADIGTLYISGNPNFGGAAHDAEKGNYAVLNTANEAEPFKNGSDDYPQENGVLIVRQDIFIAGFKNKPPAKSVIVTGRLTGGDGSIWVWAEESPYYIAQKQFARVSLPKNTSEKDAAKVFESLKAFRNARTNGMTENTTGDYLSGTIDKNQVYVIWGGGSRKVILRKVNKEYGSLVGAKFSIYRVPYDDPENHECVKVNLDEGGTLELKNLGYQGSDIIWVGVLPYGDYYLYESVAPNGYTAGKWFKLTVSAEGVGFREVDLDNKVTYRNELHAGEGID